MTDLAAMAGVTGLEPATSGVTGRRSNQLSYTPAALAPRGRQILCRLGGVNAPMSTALVGDDGIEPPTFSV